MRKLRFVDDWSNDIFNEKSAVPALLIRGDKIELFSFELSLFSFLGEKLVCMKNDAIVFTSGRNTKIQFEETSL